MVSGIFPGPDKGGVEPAPYVCNGYIPEHAVIGNGGPWYAAPDCTTSLTDCVMNSLVSEVLAAVDLLGFPYDSSRVDNLGRALVERFEHIDVDVSGFLPLIGGPEHAMQGPLILHDDATASHEAVTLRQLQHAISGVVGEVVADGVSIVGNGTTPNPLRVVNAPHLPLSGGPTHAMLGPLILHADATALLEAVTLQQLQSAITEIDLSSYLPRAGGAANAMQGPLILHGNATAALEAVTLQQLQTAITGIDLSAYLPRAGGAANAMTGPLILHGNATAPLGAVTLQQLQAITVVADGTSILGNGTTSTPLRVANAPHLPLMGGTMVPVTNATDGSSGTGIALSTSRTNWAPILRLDLQAGWGCVGMQINGPGTGVWPWATCLDVSGGMSRFVLAQIDSLETTGQADLSSWYRDTPLRVWRDLGGGLSGTETGYSVLMFGIKGVTAPGPGSPDGNLWYKRERWFVGMRNDNSFGIALGNDYLGEPPEPHINSDKDCLTIDYNTRRVNIVGGLHLSSTALANLRAQLGL